ncbi:hypothetical protein [Novosphingobium sp. CF614]|uniref:hypothetical protein n=1 Tax=Novosphingobium sp. CF614 TaxID=1884364 RepID=UPI0011600BE4|nr:hypothetical protein [Novosphingobium sp. CF614]
MQSTTYRPVPYAIGGVAYPRPAPVTHDTSADASASPRHFGPENADGFRPMFFTREAQETDAEAQLRLDWEQAVGKIITRVYTRVYSERPAREKGALFDLAV